MNVAVDVQQVRIGMLTRADNVADFFDSAVCRIAFF